MRDIIVSLGTWNWLIAGMILLGLELLAPGMFLVWLGLAAFVVGLLSFVIDWSWQTQIIVFALVSLALVPLWRRFARAGAHASDAPFLNRRMDALIGREFTLDKPIVGGVGSVRVDDTVWRVSGSDCAAGTRVRVARIAGANLFVEAV